MIRFGAVEDGGGSPSRTFQVEIARRLLDRRVEFKGTLDFAREFVPFMRDEVDAFVCCRFQGNPSCTYLRTMACGVPIAMYANEAFIGAGW